MTKTFDEFMIRVGFEPDHISRTRFRHVYYMGILSMLIVSGLFLALIVL